MTQRRHFETLEPTPVGGFANHQTELRCSFLQTLLHGSRRVRGSKNERGKRAEKVREEEGSLLREIDDQEGMRWTCAFSPTHQLAEGLGKIYPVPLGRKTAEGLEVGFLVTT